MSFLLNHLKTDNSDTSDYLNFKYVGVKNIRYILNSDCLLFSEIFKYYILN